MNAPTSKLRVRYVHTNLVAQDWRKLADFYADVFGCIPLKPQRNYSGESFEQLVGIEGARLEGIHLRLPGFGDSGPTLEIFSYEPNLPSGTASPNRRGYGHLAFEVESVSEARQAVLMAGGGAIGGVVRFPLPDGSAVTATYVTDPEGNIVELQSWEHVQVKPTA